MGKMVGYILDFGFFSSALLALEKNETKHFHLFKFIIPLKKPNITVIFSRLQITSMQKNISGKFCPNEAFQLEHYITINAVIIIKYKYINAL